MDISFYHTGDKKSTRALLREKGLTAPALE
jgi:hypothetical protein